LFLPGIVKASRRGSSMANMILQILPETKLLDISDFHLEPFTAEQLKLAGEALKKDLDRFAKEKDVLDESV